MRKYEFTGETINFEGKILHRIKATISFNNVKAGDLGGWIEKEVNLSHDGNAWVYDDAKVCDNAYVHGNAIVYGNAYLRGHAKVYGNAKVYENAIVCGNAYVRGHAKVYGDTVVNTDKILR